LGWGVGSGRKTTTNTIAGLPRGEQPNAEIRVDVVVVGDLRIMAAKGRRSMRKWPLMLGLALLAAILAAFHIFGKDGNDMVWGFAAGIGIGAVITWFVERGGP
jgi:hypothetical protein